MDHPLVSFEDDDDEDDERREECRVDGESADDDGGEKEIDEKAEEFISRFYEEMKLQRQMSCLRYNEMVYGGTRS